MRFLFQPFLGLSILIAGVIALLRYKKTDPGYYPFLLLIWIACLNEIISVTLLSLRISTNVNNNVYVLIESILILVILRKFNPNILGKILFALIAGSFVISWTFENFIYSRITHISSYFRIYYSFVIVLLSINTVNHLVVTERKSLVKIPAFLITLGFIIFFMYKILVEAFWLYGLNNSREFRNSVYTILVYLNLFVNLLFALAVLWIPRRREYIL